MIEARYLRVINREKFQHYKDRCPPWIKLHRSVVTGEERQFDDFLLLAEWEQWQLVRIWVVASQCAKPHLLAYDELWMRRAIRSTRKVPLAKFVEQGWLEVLSAGDADLLRDIASKQAGQDRGTASGSASNTPAFQPSEVLTEKTEKFPYRPVEGNIEGGQLHDLEGLSAASQLVDAIRPEFRDAGTRQVVLAYTHELEADDFKLVRRELVKRRERIRNDGKWVNGALQRMAAKRHAAAVA